jgi:hypothetical protein
MAYAKIRPRRGTEYEWASYNPVLAEGELAIQFPDSGIGTGLCKFKVGDGVSPWNNLVYAFDGTAASAIDGGGINPSALIQVRSATANAWANANPILTEREIAYDITKNAIKIGDGTSRWNSLPYLTAGTIMENDETYDFGTEDDSDLPLTLSAMEDYVTYNTNYEADPFDQYSDTTPSTDDTVEPVEPVVDPTEPSTEPTTEDDDNNTEIDSGDAEVVTTAGLQDILKPISSSDKKEDVEEEVKIEPVEEITEDDTVEEAEEEDPEDDGEFGSEDEEEVVEESTDNKK